MQTKQLKQIEFDIAHGAASSRGRFAGEALAGLRQELIRLREAAQGRCREFTATWEAWTSRTAGELLRPLAIEQDVRDARLVNGVAWGLTATELLLSVFLAIFFLVNPVFVVLLALVGIFSIKAGLLAIWRDDAQPQRTRDRLLRWVLAPSLAVTLLALVVLLFTRGVMGWLALLLLPFLNGALFALSLGVMGLAAGLFALGYLLSWSRHAEQRYNALEREAVETRRVLQKAEQVAAQLRGRDGGGGDALEAQSPIALRAAVEEAALIVPVQPQRSAMPARAGARRRANGGTDFWAAGLLLAALWGSGCKALETLPPASANSDAPAMTATAAETAALELWLDWSLSAEALPYHETVRAFTAALPALVKRLGIARVTALQFADRAWSAPTILDLALPTPPAAMAQYELGAVFGQITAEQKIQAEAQYQTALDKALASITPEKLLPTDAVEPPCTDIQGVLERIVAAARAQRRLIFVVTDGQENCARQLRPVALAAANAGLVFVLLPEAAGRQGRPDEQWRLRRDALLQAAPGAVVMPHFGDWAAAAEQAGKR